MKKLVDNIIGYTDKNTTHSYLPLYEKLLNPIADRATNILEIGIGDFLENGATSEKNGGSLLLWLDFFTKATVHAIEILGEDSVHEEVLNSDRIKTYTNTDAYNSDNIKKHFIDKGVKFDFILDDGPHTLESMMDCIKLYHFLLEDNGILIIEDVQDINWFDSLRDETPDYLKKYIKTYDLRENKNRYDDLVFTIDRINN
jgi:hypothetical protein